MRLRCRFLGCVLAREGYCCDKCNTDLYDGFIDRDRSWFAPIYQIQHRWQMKKFYRFHPCAVCETPMYFTDDHCCSQECYDDWIPF